jgi:hypothetical protein
MLASVEAEAAEIIGLNHSAQYHIDRAMEHIAEAPQVI